MIDKDVFTEPDEPTEVGVKGRKNDSRRVDPGADDGTQLTAYLINVRCGGIHLDA